MVLPDGTGSDNRQPGKRKAGIFMVAALALVVGFVILGTLTSSNTVAVEETATTSTTIEEVEPPVDPDVFTVQQIARGEPFEWDAVILLEDAYPIALFDHERWIYLFATNGPNFTGLTEGGLRGWRTADGASWEPLGQVIPEDSVITHVSSTGQGIVALEALDGGAGLALWQSDDGTEWSVEEVPHQVPEPLNAVAPTVAGGSDSMLVVAGRSGINIYARIQEELSSRDGDGLDLTNLGWGVEVTGDEVTFPLYGPLGFPLTEITPEELNLSPEEVELVIDDYHGRNPRTIVWSKIEGAGWQQTEIVDAFSIDAISPTPDGDAVALGYGFSGITSWSSSDGVNWEETEAPEGPVRVDRWQDRMVGPSDIGSASVVVSGDDGSWEDIGPGDYFPIQFDWYINAVGAGPGGVAAMVTGWDRGFTPDVIPDDPPDLTSDDATLTLNPSTNSYSLETPDGVTHNWSMNSSSAPDGIAVDLTNGAIDFHDPHTGDLLASFPIEDIAEAQDSYWGGGGGSSAAHQAFAFTPDGTDWTIQDLMATCPHSGWCQVFGGDAFILHLEVTGSHVVVVAIRGTAQYRPDLPPGFVVWSAPIP